MIVSSMEEKNLDGLNEERYEKVPFKVKILYGLGNVGGIVTQGIFTASYLKFYLDFKGLVDYPTLVTICLVLFAIWNAVNDPLFGTITDNTKSKHGRRIPYIRYIAPLYGLSFILVWFPPSDSPLALFGWMLFSMLFYDGTYTLITICYLALLPEMTLDEGERAKIAFFSMIFTLVGMVASFLIPTIFLTGEASMIVPFQIFMVILGIGSVFSFWITGFGIKERVEFMEEPRVGFFEGILKTLKNKAFLIFEVSNFCLVLVQNIVIGTLFYYLEYVLGLKGLMTYIPMMLVLLAGVIGYVFLIVYVQPKKGMYTAYVLSISVQAIGLLLPNIPGAIFTYVGISLAGFGLIGPIVLNNPMLANVIDQDELRHGKRREGMFFGTQAFITKWAISLAGIIITLVLNASGFIAKEDLLPGEGQPPSALMGIRIVMGIIPAVFLGISIIAMRFYPLKGKPLVNLKAKLQARHDEKKQPNPAS